MMEHFSQLLLLFVALVTSVGCADKTLKVTSVLNEPFLYQDDNRFSGYCYDLAKYITQKMSVNMQFGLVKDGRYGSVNPDTDEWNGMIGELIRGDADVAIAPLTVTLNRERVVSFTKPFMLTELAFVYKNPSQQMPTPDVVINMFSAFHFGVWVLLLISVILVTMGFWAVAFFINDEQFSQVGTTIDYVMSTLLFLSPKVRPTSPLIRAYSYLWLVLRLIIFIIFLVYFIKLASVQRLQPSPPMKSFDELVEKVHGEEKYNVLFLAGGSTERKFSESTSVELSLIYQGYKKSDLRAKSTSEGLEMVRKVPSTVFIGETPMLKHATLQPPCDLVMSEYMYQQTSMTPVGAYAIALPKNSPYYEIISQILNEMIEDGTLMEMELEWFGRRSACKHDSSDSEGDVTQALSVVVARSLFLLVLVLILYAIGVFIYTRLSGRPVGRPVQSVDASEKNKVPEVRLEDVRTDGKEITKDETA